MGLFDLPAPIFGAVDGILGLAFPPAIRLVLWGVLAGWLTMVAYRRLSNQERIGALKREQKERQREIAEFDGEMDELLPLIFGTLRLGFRQLGLAIGPALLATVPVLFLVAWVAGAFGYIAPQTRSVVEITTVPEAAQLAWQPSSAATATDSGWRVEWPPGETPVIISHDNVAFLALPTREPVPVIHKKQWWNLLFGNPIGYLPDDLALEQVDIGLPPQQFLPFGPGWLRGWMFLFFSVFLLASVAFKLILRID